MKLKELNLEIAKLIKEGSGEAEVYIDTEARKYDCHLILLKDIFSDEGLVDDDEHIIITIK